MAFTASNWGQGQLLTGLTPVATLGGFVAVITKDNLPTSAFDTGTTSCLNGGGDWRFSTDINGTNQLPCDIVTCVTSATPANVEFIAWIRFPTYSSGSREVYAFWNRAGQTQPATGAAFGRDEVWQDFELVVHQGTTIDSTGNHAPSLVGSPSLSTMLWGGQGYSIQSVNQYLSVPHAAGLNAEKDYSIDCWVDAGTISDGDVRTLYDKSFQNTNGYVGTVSNSAAAPSGVSRHRNPNLTNSNLDIVNQNGMQRLAYYFDGTTRTISRDASVTNSDTPTGTVTNNTESLIIGNRYDFQRPVQSTLGEFWLSIPNRQTDRNLEQSNQLNPATFWTEGEVFVPGGGGTAQPLTLEVTQQLNESTLLSIEQFNALALEVTEQVNESSLLTLSQQQAIESVISEQINQSNTVDIVNAQSIVLAPSEQVNQTNTLNINQTDGQLIVLTAVEQVNESTTVLLTELNSLTLEITEQVNVSNTVDLSQVAQASLIDVQQVNQSITLNILQSGDNTSIKGVTLTPVTEVFTLTPQETIYTLEEI